MGLFLWLRYLPEVSYVPDLATSTIKTIVINRGISQQIPNYMLK